MKEEFKLFLVFGFFVVLLVLHTCTGEAANTGPDVALWLARSCVGEAGFDSADSGECAAILSIYRKRMKPTGLSLYKVARKYSAAIKAHWNQKHLWVFQLNRELTEPLHWPAEKVRWKRYRNRWREVLTLCDDFVKGRVKDPLPLADHYGCQADRLRAIRAGWHKLKTDFKNEFWAMNDPRKVKAIDMGQIPNIYRDMINADVAARILEISGSQMRVYARAGKFQTGKKIRGTRWLFSRSEIEGIASGKVDVDFSGAYGVLYGTEG